MSRSKGQPDKGSPEGALAVTARDRRSRESMRRKEDREILSALDVLLDDCGARFEGIVEHIDSEWVIIERLRAETHEIQKKLQPR